MAAAVGSLLSLLCVAFICADAAQDCKHFAAVGQPYEVPLDYDLHENRLWWKFNSKTIYDTKNPKGYKASVNKKYDVILTKVTKDDEGIYMAEITNKSGTLITTKSIKLCVLESVEKPKVTVKCDTKLQKVQFTCTVSELQGITYKWFDNNHNKYIANESANILILTAKQAGTNSLFSCNVSNPVSSQISNPVKQDCIKDTSTTIPPNTVDEGLLFGMDFWLMVGILAGGGGLVVVLIVATIICCTINKRKRRLQVKDEQELRLQWSTANQQHQHYHNSHQHPQTQHPPTPQHPQGVTPTQGRHAATAGHTGPRPHRSRRNLPRPPDPITGQPLPGPRRQAQAPKQTVVNEEENPPPLPQPRKKGPRTQRDQNA